MMDGLLGAWLLAGTAAVRAGAGLTASVSGGQAATGTQGVSVPTTVHRLAPELSLASATEQTSFDGAYRPNLTLRFPSSPQLGQSQNLNPLVMHLLEVDLKHAVSRRLAFGSRVSGSVGQVDTAFGQATLQSGQTTVPQGGPPQLASGTIAGSVGWQAARRLKLGLQANANSSQTTTTATGVVERVGTGVAVDATRQLTARTNVAAGFGVQYQSLTRGTFLSYNPQVTVSHVVNEESQLSAGVGLALVELLEGNNQAGALPISPTAQVSVTHAGPRYGRLQWRHQAALSLVPVADQFQESFTPRLALSLGTGFEIAQSWSCGLNITGAANATTRALPGKPVETAVSANLPCQYALGSHGFGVEVRGNALGGHLTDGFPDRSQTLLAGFTYSWRPAPTLLQ